MSRRSTPVRIPEEAKRRLEELKRELGLDSLGDVINLLVGDAIGGVVTAVLDMRRDVKELVEAVKGLREELRRLNDNIEALFKKEG